MPRPGYTSSGSFTGYGGGGGRPAKIVAESHVRIDKATGKRYVIKHIPGVGSRRVEVGTDVPLTADRSAIDISKPVTTKVKPMYGVSYTYKDGVQTPVVHPTGAFVGLDRQEQQRAAEGAYVAHQAAQAEWLKDSAQRAGYSIGSYAGRKPALKRKYPIKSDYEPRVPTEEKTYYGVRGYPDAFKEVETPSTIIPTRRRVPPKAFKRGEKVKTPIVAQPFEAGEVAPTPEIQTMGVSFAGIKKLFGIEDSDRDVFVQRTRTTQPETKPTGISTLAPTTTVPTTTTTLPGVPSGIVDYSKYNIQKVKTSVAHGYKPIDKEKVEEYARTHLTEIEIGGVKEKVPLSKVGELFGREIEAQGEKYIAEGYDPALVRQSVSKTKAQSERSVGRGILQSYVADKGDVELKPISLGGLAKVFKESFVVGGVVGTGIGLVTGGPPGAVVGGVVYAPTSAVIESADYLAGDYINKVIEGSTNKLLRLQGQVVIDTHKRLGLSDAAELEAKGPYLVGYETGMRTSTQFRGVVGLGEMFGLSPGESIASVVKGTGKTAVYIFGGRAVAKVILPKPLATDIQLTKKLKLKEDLTRVSDKVIHKRTATQFEGTYKQQKNWANLWRGGEPKEFVSKVRVGMDISDDILYRSEVITQTGKETFISFGSGEVFPKSSYTVFKATSPGTGLGKSLTQQSRHLGVQIPKIKAIKTGIGKPLFTPKITRYDVVGRGLSSQLKKPALVEFYDITGTGATARTFPSFGKIQPYKQTSAISQELTKLGPSGKSLRLFDVKGLSTKLPPQLTVSRKIGDLTLIRGSSLKDVSIRIPPMKYTIYDYGGTRTVSTTGYKLQPTGKELQLKQIKIVGAKQPSFKVTELGKIKEMAFRKDLTIPEYSYPFKSTMKVWTDPKAIGIKPSVDLTKIGRFGKTLPKVKTPSQWRVGKTLDLTKFYYPKGVAGWEKTVGFMKTKPPSTPKISGVGVDSYLDVGRIYQQELYDGAYQYSRALRVPSEGVAFSELSKSLSKTIPFPAVMSIPGIKTDVRVSSELKFKAPDIGVKPKPAVKQKLETRLGVKPFSVLDQSKISKSMQRLGVRTPQLLQPSLGRITVRKTTPIRDRLQTPVPILHQQIIPIQEFAPPATPVFKPIVFKPPDLTFTPPPPFIPLIAGAGPGGRGYAKRSRRRISKFLRTNPLARWQSVLKRAFKAKKKKSKKRRI